MRAPGPALSFAGGGVAELADDVERSRGRLTVARRSEILAEGAAVCESGLAQVLVMAHPSVSDGGDDQPLTAALVARLQSAGAIVVAVCSEEGAAAQANAMGAWFLPADSNAAALQELVAQAMGDGGELAAQGQVSQAQGTQGPGTHDQSKFTPMAPATEPEAPHRVIAVWGPAGAPGKTSVAVNLAAEYAAAGYSTALLDADTYSASVAATLGMLDEAAGLAQACRLADQGTLTGEKLASAAQEVLTKTGRIAVFCGLSRPDRWPELRSAALKTVIAACRERYQVSVIDCGFCLENDEELSYDTFAPRRNAATVVSLGEADEVIAVGAADSLGVPRLIRALSELDQVMPAAYVRVVLNKVRASAVGRSPESSLHAAWDRFGPGHGIAELLPWDPDSMDKSLLQGRVLGEVAAVSAVRSGILRLAGLLPAGAKAPRRSPAAASQHAGDSAASGARAARKRPAQPQREGTGERAGGGRRRA